MTILIVNRTHNILQKNSIEVHTSIVKQTVKNINSSLSSIDTYFHYFLSNRSVLNGLVHDDFAIDPASYDSVLYLKDLMFSLITSNEGLESALYISNRGVIVTNLSGTRYPDFFNMKDFNDQEYIQNIYQNPSDDFWCVDDTVDNKLIYYLRGIREPESGRVLGILSFLIHDSLFLNQINSLSLKDSEVYICDPTGFIFIHSNGEKRGSFSSIDTELLREAEHFIIEDNEKFYVAYPTVNSWFVISEISKDLLYGDNSIIIRWAMMVSAIFIVLATLISFYVARAYTHDLTAIVTAMSTSTLGNLEQITIQGSNIETRMLSSTYNTMIDNLNKLTVDLRKEVAEKTAAENDLRTLNETLEIKVSHRTRQLEDSLSHLKLAQAQLVEKEKMASLGSLVAGIAHEINTPLGVCITAASHQAQIINDINNSYIKNKSVEENDFADFLDDSVSISTIIASNLDKVAMLVRTFKQISVDQTYELEQTINLKEYISDILFTLSPKIKKTETEIICNDSILVKTFPGALGQVITNLVMNSLIHGFKEDPTGRITIEVKTADDQVLIIYRDNGIGMDAETCRRIYDPFFTRNRNSGGTGLGMHIVYNLVTQQLKGEINCISFPAEGVEFTMTLPLS